VGWSSIDLLTQKLVPTLFSTPMFVNEFNNATITSFCLANTTTGQSESCFQSFVAPYRTAYSGLPTTCQWGNSISFLPVFGIPEISLLCGIPFADRYASFGVQVYVNLYTISGTLLSLVPSSRDRIFLIFRTAAGTMVGSSHGKYFSHSDFDFNANNPFTNPPPISEFQLFSAVNCTDGTIRSSAIWMLWEYSSWAAIPEFDTSLTLDVGTYWTRSLYIKSEVSRHSFSKMT